MGRLRLARKEDPVLINKNQKKMNLTIGGFCCSSKLQGENERKKKKINKYLNFTREVKTLEHDIE